MRIPPQRVEIDATNTHDPDPLQTLKAEDLVGYLLQANLVTPEQIVTSGITIDVLVRKNISYNVIVGNSAMLLKQPRLDGDPGIDREIAFYTKIIGQCEQLRYFTLQPILQDVARSCLVLPFLQNYMDLRRYHVSSRYAPLKLGHDLGRALAVLHSAECEYLLNGQLEAPVPWVLTLLEPDVEILLTESAGSIDVVRRIQENPTLSFLISKLADAWSSDSMCHGDMRLDNVLYAPRRHLVIVDWELCGRGSTAWDLGCLFANYVELWIVGAGRSTANDNVGATKAERNMNRFQPMLRSFWNEYNRQRRGYSSCPEPQFLAEVVGLRLLQAALEYSQRSIVVTRESIMLLSIAQRFAARPAESWVHILGLPISSFSGVIAN